MGGKKSGRKSKQKQTAIQREVANGVYHPDETSDDPEHATQSQPGVDKLDILAARSAAGLPLWDANDKTVFREGLDLIGQRGDEHLARRYATTTETRGRKKTDG